MKKGIYIKDNNKKPARDLLSREEEYKRLNEELEAKTASLIQEVDQVMKGQESLLAKPTLLENINAEDFLKDDEGDELEDEDNVNVTGQSNNSSQASGKVVNTARTPSRGKPSSRPPSRPQSKQQAKPRKPNKSARPKSNISEDVAVPDDTFLTEFRDYSLEKTISGIESRLDTEVISDEEDVMPSAAAEMGAEAQIRFLKAKLRVMQEELDRLAQECNKKEEGNNGLMSRIKDLEEEKNRFSRSNAAQQIQIDKYKKLAEDAKGKADSLENQLSSLRKDYESLKRTQKQQASSQSATDVRLNRALEEVEKYKSQLSRAKSASKDSSEQEKRRLDQLIADNKRLEKQKNELVTGFKKQMKLIDILKRQKMHIEAAKMLSFTEEEFVKALEWGN